MERRTRVSKTLSLWLRHRPDLAGLTLSSAGWAPVDQVVAALAGRGLDIGRDGLAELVANSDKLRFELSSGGEQIRARQGHSVEVEGDWAPADPPNLLYHGTVERVLAMILRDGLRPMHRHHVHLSADLGTARRVGARRGRPVVLRVAAGELSREGRSFYLTGNGVWLIDHVPPEYLERVPDDQSG